MSSTNLIMLCENKFMLVVETHFLVLNAERRRHYCGEAEENNQQVAKETEVAKKRRKAPLSKREARVRKKDSREKDSREKTSKVPTCPQRGHIQECEQPWLRKKWLGFHWRVGDS